MDKAGPGTYFRVMLRYLVLIVSACLFAVVSFTASAHETGMIVSTELASHTQPMDHGAMAKASCADDRTCKMDPGLCDLVCMGVGVFLPAGRMSAGLAMPRETYRRHPDAALVSTPPALNDRPPIAHRL
ncbi:hypothetical protein [Shinella sp. HZN7]|uniref:hypothetical protein n=1 Tax=Shinella sp. (strain HZN7) TaxID=879274 RepID=UPI0007DA80BD|nr:hypothetical protein [Shinella sp. HZN7]ANH07014.1 hypothetical protein shn_22990 [Shinella sp. HZN7]